MRLRLVCTSEDLQRDVVKAEIMDRLLGHMTQKSVARYAIGHDQARFQGRLWLADTPDMQVLDRHDGALLHEILLYCRQVNVRRHRIERQPQSIKPQALSGAISAMAKLIAGSIHIQPNHVMVSPAMNTASDTPAYSAIRKKARARFMSYWVLAINSHAEKPLTTIPSAATITTL